MTLTSTQSKAVAAYAKFLQAGITYGEAMRSAAAELGDTPCITLLEALAKVHATKYGCNYTNNDGRFTFHEGTESTRDSRNIAAFQSWRRNVMVWFTPAKEAKPKAHARITPDARKAAKAYLAQFDSVAEAIAALKAVA